MSSPREESVITCEDQSFEVPDTFYFPFPHGTSPDGSEHGLPAHSLCTKPGQALVLDSFTGI